MDWLQLEAMLQVLGSICGVAALLFGMYMRSQFVTHQHFVAEMKQVQDRLGTSDRRHDSAATGADLSNLKITIERLNGTINGLQQRLDGMSEAFNRQSDAVDRIEDHLLNRSRS